MFHEKPCWTLMACDHGPDLYVMQLRGGFMLYLPGNGIVTVPRDAFGPTTAEHAEAAEKTVKEEAKKKKK